jgi:hypothetical protein
VKCMHTYICLFLSFYYFMIFFSFFAPFFWDGVSKYTALLLLLLLLSFPANELILFIVVSESGLLLLNVYMLTVALITCHHP